VTETEDLNTILQTYQYEIPQFQRNYSWEKEHVEDFWNDAWDTINENNNNYYFGPMILVKTNQSSTFKIVDGQQRITTLSILISVIRDIATKTGNIDVHANTIMYLMNSLKRIPSLKLNNNNNEYYKDFILRDMDPEEKIKLRTTNQYEKNLYNSYKLLFVKIKEQYLGDKKKKFSTEHKDLTFDIEDFLAKVLFNFKIFKIILIDEDEASKLFATINARGLNLSISDLIKNYIFSKSTKEHQESNQEVWQYVVNTLGENIKMDKYLQHHFICWKQNVKEQKLYSSIEKEIRNPTNVKDYLKSLKHHCKIYSNMMSSNETQFVNKHLKELFLDLQNDSAQPFILNAIEKWGKTSKEVDEISKICLDIHFRAKTIGGRSAKEIVDAFAEAAESIRGLPPLIKNVKEIVDGKETIVKKEILVDISYIRKIFHQIDFTDTEFLELLKIKDFSAKNAKYFLSKIERHRPAASGTAGKTVDRTITLEHIMPQNENADGWEHMKEQHDEFLWKIGNLTLLHTTPNSSEKDNPFEKKKKAYAGSDMLITKYLEKKDDWDDVEISSRSKDLASDAPVIWKTLKNS
jgi:uncharacterized protein with ParB-like and HNH nuclease domain